MSAMPVNVRRLLTGIDTNWPLHVHREALHRRLREQSETTHGKWLKIARMERAYGELQSARSRQSREEYIQQLGKCNSCCGC